MNSAGKCTSFSILDIKLKKGEKGHKKIYRELIGSNVHLVHCRRALVASL